jgi:hypothetical protein
MKFTNLEPFQNDKTASSNEYYSTSVVTEINTYVKYGGESAARRKGPDHDSVHVLERMRIITYYLYERAYVVNDMPVCLVIHRVDDCVML